MEKGARADGRDLPAAKHAGERERPPHRRAERSRLDARLAIERLAAPEARHHQAARGGGAACERFGAGFELGARVRRREGVELQPRARRAENLWADAHPKDR